MGLKTHSDALIPNDAGSCSFLTTVTVPPPHSVCVCLRSCHSGLCVGVLLPCGSCPCTRSPRGPGPDALSRPHSQGRAHGPGPPWGAAWKDVEPETVPVWLSLGAAVCPCGSSAQRPLPTAPAPPRAAGRASPFPAIPAASSSSHSSRTGSPGRICVFTVKAAEMPFGFSVDTAFFR